MEKIQREFVQRKEPGLSISLTLINRTPACLYLETNFLQGF